MSHSLMERRCPDALFCGPAILHGYSLRFLYQSTSFPGGGAADIEPEEGSEVWGSLWQVSFRDMISLDNYEDVAQGGYRRTKVWVEIEGRRLLTLSYEVVNKLPEEMPPRQEYLQLLLRGAKEASLPADYITELSSLQSRN